MQDNLPSRIFLCGFMGAGKSTIGRALANKLSLPFIDLDEEIENQTGKAIAAIFEQEGEQAFRKIERERLEHCMASEGGIFALGGGALQNQQLTDRIKQSGILVFIECPISVILTRIMESRTRPLLLNNDGELKKKEVLKNELQTLYEQRLPFYRQAGIQIANDAHYSTEHVVNYLINKIEAYAASN